MKKLNFIGIIPARYASSRFPGKPLAMIGGKTMIQRVYERASLELERVYVATDDERIAESVRGFGGNVVMTSDKHRSGTDRVREAYEKVGDGADVVINIQGDEPFIEPSQIAQLKSSFDNDSTDIATLVRRFDPSKGFEALFDPNTPKVVKDENGYALYFSRSIIPYVRNYEWKEWVDKAEFFTHVGMYAYRAKALQEITMLSQSSLELAESLEQLRWLQNGYKIMTSVTEADTIGIDTPADLEKAQEMIAEKEK